MKTRHYTTYAGAKRRRDGLKIVKYGKHYRDISNKIKRIISRWLTFPHPSHIFFLFDWNHSKTTTKRKRTNKKANKEKENIQPSLSWVWFCKRKHTFIKEHYITKTSQTDLHWVVCDSPGLWCLHRESGYSPTPLDTSCSEKPMKSCSYFIITVWILAPSLTNFYHQWE